MIEPTRNEWDIDSKAANVTAIEARKCVYRDRCEAYKAESVTCTKDRNKVYCGIFREFRDGLITKWTKK